MADDEQTTAIAIDDEAAIEVYLEAVDELIDRARQEIKNNESLMDEVKQMRVKQGLKIWLGEKYGIRTDLLDEAPIYSEHVKKAVIDGDLTLERIKQLNVNPTEGSDNMSTANTNTNASPNTTKATPSALLGAAGGGNGGNTIRVKLPSEMYCKDTKLGLHAKTNQPIYLSGSPLYTPSELQLAKTGVFVKHHMASYATLLQKYGHHVPSLNEHERALLQEVYTGDAFCGTKSNGDWVDRTTIEQSGLSVKSLLDDALSGGQNLVPFDFDTSVITKVLLHSEILPFVEMRETRSSEVQTAKFGHVTVAWGPAEGSEISRFDTDALVSNLTVPIFPVTASCLLGKDAQADSPVAIGAVMTDLFSQELLQELDYVVCCGNGSSQPEGFFTTVGTNALNADNTGTGPPTLNDYIKLQFGIAKQYRKAEFNPAYVSNDVTYQRSRQLKVDPGVSPTDQRLLFGMNLQAYDSLGYPHKIQQAIGNRSSAFVCLKKYRMYRRSGFDFFFTDQGENLARRNEVLMVVRGRYGGVLTDVDACAVMEDGQS